MRTKIVYFSFVLIAANTTASAASTFEAKQLCSAIFNLGEISRPLVFTWEEINPIALIQNSKSVNIDSGKTSLISKIFSRIKPAKLQKTLDLVSLAKTMGFDISNEMNAAKLIDEEIEKFLNIASPYELAEELGGRNGLTGDPRGSSAAANIMKNSELNLKQKKDALVDLYRQNPYRWRENLIQVVRDKDNLEKRVGGWSNYWTGFYQNILNHSDNLDHFRTVSSSMDGMLFLPSPEPNSIIIYADTFEASNPLDYIYAANRGVPIEVSDLHVYQEKASINGSGYSLKFVAVVRPAKDQLSSNDIPVNLAQESLQKVNPNDFIVKPFKVSEETLALAKNSDGSYSFYFIKGYKYRSRLDSNQTPNGHDTTGAIESALSDTGIKMSDLEQRRAEDGTLILSFNNTPSDQQISKFELLLAQRLLELIDPVSSRSSRASKYALGVSDKEAKNFEFSGYTTREDLVIGMGMDKIGGGSVHSSGDLWHATLPILFYEKNGLSSLSVDDRIYAVGAFKGESELEQAKANIMMPVKMSGGAYIVYSGAQNAGLWSGFIETFNIFANKELAQDYIRTHRFTVR